MRSYLETNHRSNCITSLNGKKALIAAASGNYYVFQPVFVLFLQHPHSLDKFILFKIDLFYILSSIDFTNQ